MGVGWQGGHQSYCWITGCIRKDFEKFEKNNLVPRAFSLAPRQKKGPGNEAVKKKIAEKCRKSCLKILESIFIE